MQTCLLTWTACQILAIVVNLLAGWPNVRFSYTKLGQGKLCHIHSNSQWSWECYEGLTFEMYYLL